MVDKKKIIGKGLVFLLVSSFVVLFGFVNAADNIALTFSSQSASSLGSNGSLVSIDSNVNYINKGENSSVIGNYFTGYYYDSVLGYFQMNPSPDASENVRVVGSTGRCLSGYGYKLGGYAYSESFGYIDFDYDANTYVYYCVETGSLFGHAYSSSLGYQNFEGITFEIETQGNLSIDAPVGNESFVNDTTEIIEEGGVVPPAGESEFENSNFNFNSIQNDQIEFNESYESLFYIIK